MAKDELEKHHCPAISRKGVGRGECFRAVLHRKGEGPMNQELEGEGLIRSKDAARYLCVSEWPLRKLTHEGKLPYVQITDRSPMPFDKVDLRAWIERGKFAK